MKRIYKIIIIFCIIALLCIIFFDDIVKLIVEDTAQRRRMPEKGIYLCQECDTRIDFLTSETRIVYADGTSESVNIDYGNNLFGSTTDLRACIVWNQKDDVIELKIKSGNENLKEETEHCFARESRDNALP